MTIEMYEKLILGCHRMWAKIGCNGIERSRDGSVSKGLWILSVIETSKIETLYRSLRPLNKHKRVLERIKHQMESGYQDSADSNKDYERKAKVVSCTVEEIVRAKNQSLEL